MLVEINQMRECSGLRENREHTARAPAVSRVCLKRFQALRVVLPQGVAFEIGLIEAALALEQEYATA
jgi:hypothetical protein